MRSKNIPVFGVSFLSRKIDNLFLAVFGRRRVFFEGVPCWDFGAALRQDIDDKETFRALLARHKFPHSRGKSFWVVRRAIRFAEEIGFPLVVKPRNGSLSRHTVCNIRSMQELRTAIDIARAIHPEFIVEEFIPGNNYRVTLVGNVVAACCLRERPSVMGDGKHTIAQLIRLKNNDVRRGGANQKNTTLHKIAVSPTTENLLAKQGFKPGTILPLGAKAHLHDKIILACGADIRDCTEEMHPENKNLFETLARLINAPLLGIDFICENIARTYRSQPSAIIEANTLPYIDMHHYPTAGKPRNVARMIVEAKFGAKLHSHLPNSPLEHF
jgi:cyanophycin synthetase